MRFTNGRRPGSMVEIVEVVFMVVLVGTTYVMLVSSALSAVTA